MTPAPTPNKTVKKVSPLATLLAYIQRMCLSLGFITFDLFLDFYIFLYWIFRDKKIVERLFAYTQRQWRPLALVVLYIFFCPTFEDRVASLLESFDPSLGSFIVWLLLLVVALVYTYVLIRRRYVLSEGLRAWTVVMFAGWAYYRFVGATHYEATPIPQIPWACYIDLFFVLCFYIALIAGCSLWMRRKSKKEVADNSRAGYHVEHPCTSEDEDLLGRRKEAETLAEKIFQTDTSRGAFTLGLTAPWGAGKTSFMLVMKEYLERQPEEKVIVIEFNPWRYRKAPNLTQIFFEELSRALAPYNSALSSGFVHYVDHLLAKDSNPWLQLASRLLPQESNVKSTGEQYDFLTREISKLGRKIFIFIDDVDRLEREELVELFALVRNSSSFPCMSYILAYDKEYVASQLKGCFDQHTYRYMEKILQEEYALAQITPEQLEHALETELERIGHGALFAAIEESQILLGYHLPTIRAVKRICNTLSSCRKDLEGNVALFDWFIIELIRIQYPRLFDFLRENYISAFFVNVNSQVVMQIGEEGIKSASTRETVVDFEQYLHENKKELGIDSPYHILELMKKLWGRSREKLIPQANDWGCIGRYFYRTMREGEFDIAEFRQYLSLPLIDGQQHPMKKIIPYLDRICNSSSKDRFIKLIHEIDLRPEEALNMLYIYFYIQSRDEVQRVIVLESNKWINTIRVQEGGREREILEDLFSYTDIRKGILLYISAVINSAVINSVEPIPIPFTREELEGIKEKLFLDYTEDATSIDPIACYRLWLQCRTRHKVELYGGVLTPIDPEKSSHRMNEKMKGIIEENIEQLIPYFIQSPWDEDPWSKPKHYRPYLPYPIWTLDKEEVNSEIGDFELFISGLNATSPSVIEEFQRFLEEWLNYVSRLREYLEDPWERERYVTLSEYDKPRVQEWIRRNPEHYQALKQNKRQFFELLGYQITDAFGFTSFAFEVIQPKDI